MIHHPRHAYIITTIALLCATTAFSQDTAKDVAARVNGAEITQSDVAFAAPLFGDPAPNISPEARTSAVVDALVDIKLLAEAARKAGIDKDPEYQRQLNFLSEQALRSTYLSQQLDKAVSDAAIRKIYDQQVAAIPPSEEIKLSHILLKSREDATAVIAALTAGESFKTLAASRSTDTVTGSKGGDLGFRPRQALPAEINTALDGLKPGDFAKTPVETAFGFHVVRLDEMRNTPPPSFETVAPQIRQSLETAEIRRIVTGLRSSAKVEKLVPDVALPAASDDGHNHDGQNAE